MLARARIAGTLLLGQGVGRGAQAVYGVLMVRELSASGYGNFAYILAIGGILVAVGDLGFSRLIIRDVARSADPARLVRELLRVRTPGVIVLSAAFAAVGAAGGLPDGMSLALAAGAYLLAEGFAYGYEAAAAGSERPGRFAGAQAVGGFAVIVAALVVLSASGVTPAGAMAGLAAASAIKLAAHRAIWRGRAAKARALQELPVRQWLGEAVPFLLLALLTALYYRAAIVVLHALEGPEETAPFAAAMRVFDAVAVLGGVGFAAVSPLVSRLDRDRPKELWAVWQRMVGIAAAVIVPATALLALGAEPVARALFGARYAESAGQVLAILAPGMALAVLQGLNASIVLMSGDLRAVIRLTLVNVAALLIIVTVFTFTSGATGAAVAISVAELLSFTTFALLIQRRHRMPRVPRRPSLTVEAVIGAWDHPRARAAADRLLMLAAALLPLSAAATLDVGFTLTLAYLLSGVAVVVGFPSVIRGVLRVPRPVIVSALAVLAIYAIGVGVGSDLGLESQPARSNFRDLVYLLDIAMGLAVAALLVDVAARRHSASSLMRWLCAGAAIAALYAIYQWFAQHYGWPWSNVNNTLNSDGVTTGARDQGPGVFGWQRVRGTFKEPLYLASHLAIALPLAVMLVRGARGRPRAAWAGAAGAMAVALVLTSSTLAVSVLLLASAVAGCLWAVQRGRPRPAAVLGAAAAIALLCAPALFVEPGVLSSVTGRSQAELRLTSDNRLDAWRDATNQWSQRPVVGFGPGQSSIRLAYRPDLGPSVEAPVVLGSAQGLWAASLVDTGLLGFFAWIAFFVLVGWSVVTSLRRGSGGAVFACAAAGITAVLLGQLSGDRLDLRAWFALGLLLAASSLTRREQADEGNQKAAETA